MNDVRRLIYGTIFLFLLTVVVWIGTLFLFSCGLNFACGQAAQKVDRTPIPTLIPVLHTETPVGEATLAEFNKCEVSATDLIGAWVNAGYPETDAFPFSDVHDNPCEGTFAADIQPLFRENQLWYMGSIGCVSCHNSALTERSGGLDLTSYQSILMGSRRASDKAKGTDILGGGKWEGSILYNVLVKQGLVPEGHSPDTPPVHLVIFAGQVSEEASTTTATPTPTP